MIERYSRSRMNYIWTNQHKFQKMMEVEIAACEAHAKLGNIPRKALVNIKKKAKFNLKRIEELDKKTITMSLRSCRIFRRI